MLPWQTPHDDEQAQVLRRIQCHHVLSSMIGGISWVLVADHDVCR